MSYHNLGGTIRSQTAQQSLSKLLSIAKKIGITRIANVTGLDNIGIDTAIAIRPESKHLSVSQGKGCSLELAKVSAIMESIETYHAENTRAADLTGRYNKLKDSYPLLPFDSYPLGQITIPTQENLQWLKAIDLQTSKDIYVPRLLVDLDSSRMTEQDYYFASNSNGLASGNTREEALCHAIYEIIERHCIFNLDDSCKVNLETVNDAINSNLINKIQQANLKVHIVDASNELNIPCFHCVIEDQSLRELKVFSGSGCHLNREVALARAITEAAQTRLTIISGSRDDILPVYYQTPQDDFIDNSSNLKAYNDCPQSQNTNSIDDDLKCLLEKLKKHQVVAFDHTKNELGVPVYHVFIPGMSFSGERI